MLARVQIEHEVHQSALEFRAQIPVHGEARPGQLDRTLQIENAEFRAEVPVRLGSEIKFWRSAPTPDFDVVVRTLPDGNTPVRKIWNPGQNFRQAIVEI